MMNHESASAESFNFDHNYFLVFVKIFYDYYRIN